MGIFTFIDSIDNKTLFIYIIIIVYSLVYFRNKKIGLNIIFALIFAGIIIAYIHDKKNTIGNTEDIKEEIKLDSIKPVPINFANKEDITDLLFSIQDMYHYNPQAYEEMIENLRIFFAIYYDIKESIPLYDHHYQIATSKKENALNALHSMVISIPNDEAYMDKFNRAHKRLETLLNGYINELYDQCQLNVYNNGYNVYRRAINTGPKEANGIDRDFTYEFY